MYILRAFAFLLLFLAQFVRAEQPTPILPNPKLTPGDTFDVTAQDVCILGYAKKVRAVPAWLLQSRIFATVFQLKVADVEELVRAMQFSRVVVISRHKRLLFVRLG